MSRLLILLTLISCVAEQRKLHLEDRFFLTWLSATDIKINKIYKNKASWFDRPYNAEVPLAEITYFAADSLNKLKDCVYWQVPGRGNSNGKLSFYATKASEECSASKPEKTVLVRDIRQFKMVFTRGEEVKVDNYGVLESFKLLIQYQGSDKKKPLRNLLTSLVNFAPQQYVNPVVEAERFSSSLSKTVFPGLHVHAIGSVFKKELMLKNEPWVGNIKDSYQTKSLKFCELFDQNCVTLKKYSCQNCRYGHYEVASACAKANNRVCGVNKCGQKGELACPRGHEHGQDPETAGCLKDSTSGFCQKGLVPTCFEKKYLVCL